MPGLVPDEACDYLFKIILLGDSDVGKTCVVHRFHSGHFRERHHNTIGVDFSVRSLLLDNKKVKIQVWDTAGQERFRTITQSYYRSAHGAILAYDLTRRSTFESIPHWIHEIEKYGAANLVIMLIVLRNKKSCHQSYTLVSLLLFSSTKGVFCDGGAIFSEREKPQTNEQSSVKLSYGMNIYLSAAFFQ